MSVSRRPKESSIEALRRLLTAEFKHKLCSLSALRQKGGSPTDEDVSAIERLSKLIAVLPPRDDHASRHIDLVLLCLAIPILLISAFVRLPSSAVDLEVRATRFILDLGGNRSAILVPGESGEIIALSQARISGASEISPAAKKQGTAVELRQLTLSKQPTGVRPADLAVRLQEIAIPSDAPSKLEVGLAYAAQSRGLVLHAVGPNPATAQFGEVIAIDSVESLAQSCCAIRPVRVSGKDLEMELFPFNADRSVTVLRDVRVAGISFLDNQHSSILGGSVVVKSRGADRIAIQPSDNLTLHSAKPMLVRELTLSKGELRLTLASADANEILVGDDSPRDLRPTLFEWIRFRWPTQLYGTLSALVALWFAARSWWKSPKGA